VGFHPSSEAEVQTMYDTALTHIGSREIAR
jgi:hypothetical protein